MAFCMAQICGGVGTLLQDKVSCLQYCVQNYSKIHDSDDSVRFSPKTSLDKPFLSVAQHMTFLHVRTLRSCTRFQVPARMTCCRPEKDLLLLFWNAASTAANAYCKTRMSVLPYPQSLYVRNYASWMSPITSVHIPLSWNSKTPQEFLHGFSAHSCAVFRRCVGSLQLPASFQGLLSPRGWRGFPAQELEEVNPMMLFLVLFGIFAGWIWGIRSRNSREFLSGKRMKTFSLKGSRKFLDNILYT